MSAPLTPPQFGDPELEPQPESGEPAIGSIALRSIALTVLAVLAVFYTPLFCGVVAGPHRGGRSSRHAAFASRTVPRRVPRATSCGICDRRRRHDRNCRGRRGCAAGPAAEWLEKAPQSLRKIEQKFVSFRGQIENFQQTTDHLNDSSGVKASSEPQDVRVVRPALTDLVLSGSLQVAASAASIAILVYFLLASGDVFLRKLVTVIPTLKDKKRAVEITRQIETDISFYLSSFTMVNVALGVVMAAVTALLGISNPLLWGAVVGLLNFVPYVGALSSMAILAMVGVQTFDSLPQALAAPAILLALVIISAEVITPFVLGRGLQLNPVAIFIAILLWGWLWGLTGVLLAVPLLASFKIICERVEPLHPIAEFLTI
jgi:predicted PurR-regulated permease PerM